MTFGRCGAWPTILEGKKEEGSEMRPAERTVSAGKNPTDQTAPAEEVAAAHIESAVPRFQAST
jgi:hypothetical protein